MDKKGITLKPEFEQAVMDLGFSEFTEIQEKCIPLIQQGKDVIGESHTGSGKTAAFGFPALEKVVSGKGVQLLVIVPTRELCNQVAKEFKKFTKYKKTFIVELYGGVAIEPQISFLRRAEVIVSTPGRLLDHLTRETLKLNLLKILILDEADKMFEMGFINDLNKILSRVPRDSQKLLFSATMPREITNIVKNHMYNPERVKMPTYVDASKLLQHYYETTRNNKFSLLVHVVKTHPKGPIIIFCASRRTVDVIDRNLKRQNIKSEALHGGITQSRRRHVMEEFRDSKLNVLIASDVAARGLDIKDIQLIINYDLPKTSQEYVHRIGRTARAGKEGKVISLLTHEDHDNFRRILEDRSILIHKMATPEFQQIMFVRPQRSEMSQRNQNRSSYNRSSNSSDRRFPQHRRRYNT